MLTVLMPRQSDQQEQVPAGILIHGPQGCGKTLHAAALAAHYGKTVIVDDWHLGMPVPEHALALTCRNDISGAIAFDDAMQAAGLATVSSTSNPAQATAFCVNCAHIRHADKPAPFCAAAISHVSPVFGPRHEYCQIARAERGECGVEGRLFAQHAPLTNFVQATGSRDPLPGLADSDRRFAVVSVSPGSAIRTITFATDHLFAIELALEARIAFIKQQIGFNPDDMHWRDALDVSNQALELVE